ncbi:MAG: acyl carrier protein [Prevotella sp.]|nr:acyl carrier protein [Prevotella sp.]
MELERFISDFADQFDDTDVSEINAGTEFYELEEWSSLTMMGLIALVRTKYGKIITGKEIRDCTTVKDLFDLINSK